MQIIKLLGRILLASIFIMSGVENFQNPEPTRTLMVTRYEVVYNQFVSQTKITNLPTYLKPNFVKQHGSEIVIGIFGFSILGGVLVILNVAIGGWMLALFILVTVTIIHNPFVFNKTHEQQIEETIQFVKNFGIFGGLLLVGCKSKKKPNIVAKPKQQKTEKEPKKIEKSSKGQDKDKKVKQN